MSNDNDKDQEYQKNMGKRLRKIRKENALSQDDVADALGICTKQYQSINTQWMLNRINYVLVIKMESAIIESDKRLSKQMCNYRIRLAIIEENGDKIRNIEGNGDILENIEGNGVKISCGGRQEIQL